MTAAPLAVLSVTGSRHPLPHPQWQAAWRLARVLLGKGLRELHHGCCTGADEAFARVGREMALRVVARPGDLTQWVSEAAREASDEVFAAAPNRERNALLVSAADLLVACPSGAESDASQRRGGTWQTVRLARRRGLPLALVMPDGTLCLERWPAVG